MIIKENVDINTENKNDRETSKEESKKYRAIFPQLVDLVEKRGNVHYLIKEGNELITSSRYYDHNSFVYPPNKGRLPFQFLPREDEVKYHFANDKDPLLYEDLLKYHMSISDLPSINHYHLLVAWDFHTYLQEKFNFSPYIWLYAIPERGKSRTGRGCINVAYRGITIESLRESFLFRVATDLNCSLFIDVMDLWKKAEKYESVDMLLSRFDKGVKVPRVENPNKGSFEDINYYNIFGPTIVGTNRPLDETLESRSILITMPESNKEFEEDVTPERALPLKERLVAFRARNLNIEFPEMLKSVKGRLGDITKPLLQIINHVKPDKQHFITDLISQIEKQRKLNKSDSLEANIISVVDSMDDQVSEGNLYVKEITRRYNFERNEKYQTTPHKVGHRLAALGFEKGRDRSGAYIVYHKPLIDKLVEKYGLFSHSLDSENNEEE